MTPPSVLLRGLTDDMRSGFPDGMTRAEIDTLIVGLDLLTARARQTEVTLDYLTAEGEEQSRLDANVAEVEALDGIEVASLGSDTTMDQLVAVVASAFGERL